MIEAVCLKHILHCKMSVNFYVCHKLNNYLKIMGFFNEIVSEGFHIFFQLDQLHLYLISPNTRYKNVCGIHGNSYSVFVLVMYFFSCIVVISTFCLKATSYNVKYFFKDIK